MLCCDGAVSESKRSLSLSRRVLLTRLRLLYSVLVTGGDDDDDVYSFDRQTDTIKRDITRTRRNSRSV